MDEAEMINRSHYRRAYNYLRTTVQQSSFVSNRRNLSRTNADPDVDVVSQTSAAAVELVLFPSYARFLHDREAKLDLRVHGWLYSPVPSGKQSRRNRYTMLLARSIAGLPALPTMEPQSRPGTSETNDSEPQQHMESEASTSYTRSEASEPATPVSVEFESDIRPSRSHESTEEFVRPLRMRQDSELSLQSDTSSGSRFSRYFNEHDIMNCHANLASRMAPFLAKPVINKPVKVELFAEDRLIMTETMYTGDNGHFRGTIEISTRDIDLSKLDSLVARIRDIGADAGHTGFTVLRDSGVSVISDMDDTVKHTDIVAGMREAFRNAFVRDLWTLEVPGVREWYTSMAELGCPIHYVSNAPYQLWPCLASFLRIAKLPMGSIHLKQYSGMIQGLFEPAAEKKRANVTRILLDFPKRKFLLIGDSGEQDLELYTELAQSEFANQILGIFIRDVSSGAAPSDDSSGATGEGFFSQGSGDDKIDDVVRSSTEPLKDVNESQEDILGLHTGSDTSTKDKSATHMYDLLSLQDSLSSSNISPMAVAEAAGQVSSAVPPLPKRPSALRKLLVRTDDKVEAERARPMLLRTSSSASRTSSPPKSPTKRPSMLRTLSANSISYAENRKLTEAQKMSRRVSRARAVLPKGIKLYIWRKGGDAQLHAEELIRKAKNDV